MELYIALAFFGAGWFGWDIPTRKTAIDVSKQRLIVLGLNYSNVGFLLYSLSSAKSGR
tara:strand:- start:457 stop:630 length:174 start_codon:yes stop_codon:yes gene_type:complete